MCYTISPKRPLAGLFRAQRRRASLLRKTPTARRGFWARERLPRADSGRDGGRVKERPKAPEERTGRTGSPIEQQKLRGRAQGGEDSRKPDRAPLRPRFLLHAAVDAGARDGGRRRRRQARRATAGSPIEQQKPRGRAQGDEDSRETGRAPLRPCFLLRAAVDAGARDGGRRRRRQARRATVSI